MATHYALLEGASQSLSIRRDDLDGTLYFPRKGEPPAVMIFDNVPGGAGHAKRIADELNSVFRAAYNRIENDCCGPETSCSECLRNYRNQPYHDELKRGVLFFWCGGFARDRCDLLDRLGSQAHVSYSCGLCLG